MFNAYLNKSSNKNNLKLTTISAVQQYNVMT